MPLHHQNKNKKQKKRNIKLRKIKAWKNISVQVYYNKTG